MHQGQFPPQGPYSWYAGAPAMPRAFKPHPHSNAPNSQRSDGGPRMRGSMNGPPGFSPMPNYSQRNFSKNAGGFYNNNGTHGAETMHAESLEISSNGPFLPQRAGVHGFHLPNNTYGGWREGGQEMKFQANDHSRDPSSNVLADLPSRQETLEGVASGDLPATRKKKKKKSTSDNVQNPCEGALPSSSDLPFNCNQAPSYISGTASDIQDDYDQAANLCNKLWTEFERARKLRERVLKGREQKVAQLGTEKKAIEEQRKLAADLKIEVSVLKEQAKVERMRMEEEARKIMEERESIERTSTDIAVQMAELKQVQRQIEKEKTALSALKAELDAREKLLDEREGASPTEELLPGAFRFDAGVTKSNENQRHKVVSGSQIGTIHRQVQADVQPSLRTTYGNHKATVTTLPNSPDPPVQEGGVKFLSIVKVEPVAQEDIAGDNVQNRHDSGHDDKVVEELVSASPHTRRKYQRVGLFQRGEVEDSKMPQESEFDPLPRKLAGQKQDSNGWGSKPLSHNSFMKKNQVPIEVALQEDAPGLLEQLLEKGLLEDMHVYGDASHDEPSGSEPASNEFGELESVVGKLWGSSSGLMKEIVPLKGQASNTGTLPRYCLACLLSLIEQTKALRRRKWPVEWGWCRRLHAFLFVFEKHNRIVMERPEYGFATYFFELVQSLPVTWQVQRLITVMSVASTGRAALLENRQLEVGRDLTPEEAAILEDYGWNPSSGLGSLLNFCHRVVHDYNKGQDIADLGTDWKQKIGKLLMDGYDQGSIVQSFPKKLQKLVNDNSTVNDEMPAVQIKDEPACLSNSV